MNNARRRSYIVLAMLIGLTLLAGCSGGSTTQPDPGLQQPPPGQQPPPEQQQPPSDPQCQVPDAGKISAFFNTHTNTFSLTGAPGAVLPSARVVIEDTQNFVESTDANADGSFLFEDGDVPPNFDRSVGGMIDIMQFTADTLRSEPVTVVTQAIN